MGESMIEATGSLCFALAVLSGVLAVITLNLRHQLRTARAQADWCAELASRAKQTLKQAIGQIAETTEQLELRLHKPQ